MTVENSGRQEEIRSKQATGNNRLWLGDKVLKAGVLIEVVTVWCQCYSVN